MKTEENGRKQEDPNLKFDSLEELPVLGLGQLQHRVDALQNRVAGDFAHFYELIFKN